MCPRNCNADRFSDKLGYCNSDAGFRISSICVHKGEEPAISGKKGICNVFFPHCNLQCVYCQNYEISDNKDTISTEMFSLNEVIRRIESVLEKTENIVGFVSPSHYIPQMMAIIRGLHEIGKKPVIVYNTNGYDKAESLKMLEGIIDVYLPDFKYIGEKMAYYYSRARNYPEIATRALKEMYRQKGSTLIVNDDGLAESGIIVRHLVLPGESHQSVEILKLLAEELSPKLHISLMAQYFPTVRIAGLPGLNRTITNEEYELVVKAFYDLGFQKGWIQEIESSTLYRPDFLSGQPFEKEEAR